MTGLVLGPIVGGVHAHGARLWGRAEKQTMLYAWVGQDPYLRDAQYVGATLLTAESGFAGVVSVDGLRPETRYHYALRLEEGPPSPEGGPYPSFVTAPEKGRPSPFAFAFGSCFLPRRPEDAAIFSALYRLQQQDETLRFALFLGDQVYADDWRYNGLGRVPQSTEDYRAVYYHVWRALPLRNLFANLPAFMMWDDHEVDDDWHWVDLARTAAAIPWWDRVLRRLHRLPPEARRLERQRVRAATQAFWEHQVLHAPPLLQPPEGVEFGRPLLLPGDAGHFGYAFAYGAAAFFVLDLRSQRVRGAEGRRLMHPVQWEALESWLEESEAYAAVRFVASSVTALGDLWLDFAQDRWSGFPDERRRLLHLLATHARRRPVFLLSGDLHNGFAVRAVLDAGGGQTAEVWEFSASPFAQQPFRWARWLFRGAHGSPVQHVARKALVLQPHFAVIRVAYDPAVQVRYEAYDIRGKRIAEVTVEGASFPEGGR